MKKILTICLLLICMTIPVSAQKPTNCISPVYPPEKIILHNVMNEETAFSIFDSFLRPKKDMPLYLVPALDSPRVTTLPAKTYAKIVANQIHIFPYKCEKALSGNHPDADIIYIMAPCGNDTYYIWQDDVIQIKNIKKKFATQEELWLCLKDPETALEGWVLVNNPKDWYKDKNTGIYLQKNKNAFYNCN